jgi:hypothetical protein
MYYLFELFYYCDNEREREDDEREREKIVREREKRQ